MYPLMAADADTAPQASGPYADPLPFVYRQLPIL